MDALIIEDEIFASQHLEKLIKKYDAGISILTKLDSIKKTVKWFEENKQPDIVFLDIQLADGLSFEIFERTQIDSPIIFTTAYNEYAIKAFKVNSVDYLVKPIDFKDLAGAIDKLKKLHNSTQPKNVNPSPAIIDQVMQMLSKQYKARFLTKIGLRIKSIPSEEIICFYSLEKATYLQTTEGKSYDIDYTLDQLETLVDPAKFFRINRKYLINISSVKEALIFSTNRLKLILVHNSSDDLIVSREKVQDFKNWLDK